MGKEKGGEGRGRWEASVRNASLLQDNPRAGPVCFKSNQSIRINYPPYHPHLPQHTHKHYSVVLLTLAQAVWMRVLSFLSL